MALASALANSLAFSTVIGGLGGGTFACPVVSCRLLSFVDCATIGVRDDDVIVADGLIAADGLVVDVDVAVAEGLGIVGKLRVTISLKFSWRLAVLGLIFFALNSACIL